MSSIKIENITKIYGSSKSINQAQKMLEQGESKDNIVQQTGATVGVDNATLNINEGETFVIMGLSGSGKSTLLRMINRLIEPTSGSIYIDDDNVATANEDDLREIRRKKVSMVFQNFGLFPHKTVLENTEFGLEIQGMPKEERQVLAEKALDNSGLLSYKDQFPNQLSGGMQQRVGLARALANDPEVLLMDEAFSALDPLIRRDMQDELVDLQKRVNKTIVFITHDLDEALRIGDRIALMKDGEVVQVGTGEEILMNPASGYVERFVENVDKSKVYVAENAMQRPTFVLNKDKEGARIAMQRMDQYDFSFLLVRDNEQILNGYVTDSDINDLLQQQTKDSNRESFISVDSVIKKDMPTVQLDTPLQDTYEIMHHSNMPLSVIDRENRLRGIISRKMVIRLLAGEDPSEEFKMFDAKGGIENE